MARAPDDIRKRLDELISQCDVFLPSRDRTNSDEPRTPLKFSAPRSDLWRFLISSIQTVRSSCGEDSPHLRELERVRERFLIDNGPGLDLDTCRGVLEAARDDLSAGMLADLRQLVAAEAFGDLLESAVYLLEEKHFVPAIAVAGAVLESSMRTLAKSKEVSWSGSSAINKLNIALYSASIYDKVLFGEIEAWGKLRNRVDHGDFTRVDDIDPGSAARMIDGVRDFVARYR